MLKISKILLVSIGSSESIDTWSGVPYFLRKSLLEKGISVEVLNLEPNHIIKIVYNKVICRVIDVLTSKGESCIYRSFFFRVYSRVRTNYVLRKIPDIDAIISCSYLVNFGPHKCPLILFSDWPHSYVLRRNNYKPSKYLAYWDEIEMSNIKSADGVLSLFSTCARYCNDELKFDKVKYLGINVINSLTDLVNPQFVINQKAQAKKIIFVGRDHYIQAAIDLIEVFPQLKEVMPEICLEIIGLQKNAVCEYIGDIHQDIIFRGYLSKSVDIERKLYYEALESASVFVNINEGWSGYTSMVEAMYYCTPVIVYPCAELIEEFGQDITFGCYCKHKSQLKESILSILMSPNYSFLCENAHNIVAGYTWENYSSKLLKFIEVLSK